MTLELTPTHLAATSLDRVWEALDRGGWKPTRRANSFKALCPIHGDANPSLSVKYDPSDGKVALHCFGCQAHVADITAAIGLGVPDLFDAPLPDNFRSSAREPRRKRPSLPPRITRDETAPKAPNLDGAIWQRVKDYEYVDEAGTVLQRVHREETVVDGQRHKRFTQSYRGSAGRWVQRKPKGFAPLLYNLPAVAAAAATGGDVWLLEGEKDVDNATSRDLVATTNAGGASTFPPELLERFAGAHVHLVVDNDLAGYQRAVSLTEQLRGRGIPVTTYLPAPTERKADFTDHLDAGGTIDDLVTISLEDAKALAAAAEAPKLLERVEICQREATAQLEASGQDRATGERHAEAWARESANRFDRIASLQPRADVEYSTRGAAAAAQFRTVLEDAATIALSTFQLASLSTPQRITAALPAPAGEPARKTTVKFGAPGEAPPPASDGRGDGGGVINLRIEDGEELPFIHGSEFDVVGGITVQVKRERVGESWHKKYYRIMWGWGEVVSESVEDDGSDSEIARPPHTITIRFHRPLLTSKGVPLHDPDTGELRADVATVKFSDEQVRDGSWARALPWPDFLESYTRNALTTAWSAIYRARPSIREKTTVFTTLGWRRTPDGPLFVHAAGAIAATGPRQVDVDASTPYAVCALPAPVSERDELRRAWLDGTLDLKDSGILQRVLAPLLGHSWGSVLTPSDMLMHLAGGRASFKSAHARVACQYFAPDLHFRGTKEMLSGANQGTTTIGLIRALGGASHIPVLVDDFAPDGDAKRAQRKLSELARTVFNGIGRITGKQRGGINVDRPIEANIITTGELTASGSGDTRIVNLPLDPHSTADGRALFARLESRRHRTARGMLGAALIRWVAEHRDELLAELEEADEGAEKSKYAPDDYWERRLARLPHDAGLLGRLVNAAVTLDRGISIMLRMLRSHDAISSDEATQFYRWARDGIYDAICLQDSSAGDPAEQLLTYLREAIVARRAHLTMDDGQAPAEPDSLGWIWQGGSEFGQWRPAGERVGVIKGTGADARLYLLPSQAIAIANMMASKADETFSETAVSIGSALASHGWVTPNRQGEHQDRKRIGGQQLRVWDIPLAAFAGIDPEEPDASGDGPAPGDGPPPGLFDEPHGDVAPSGPPHGGLDETYEPPGDEPAPFEPDPYEPAPEPVAPAADASPRPASRPAARPAAAGRFRASVAVLDTDGLWLPDGERIEMSDPIVHVGQLAILAAKLHLGTQINTGANKLRKTERGQVYVTRDAAVAMGIPFDTLPDSSTFRFVEKLREATTDHPFITRAREAGFQVSGKDAIDPSVECWRDDNRDVGVLVSFLPAQQNAFHTSILAGAPEPHVIARRLQRFTDALRFPYRKNASTTGLDLMFALHPRADRDRLFGPVRTPQAVTDAGFQPLNIDLNWQRPLDGAEKTHRWVHAFDRGGSYLAAAAGLDLPIGEPTLHPEGIAFTQQTKLPGYWKITAPSEPGMWCIPNPIAPQGRSGPAFPSSQLWVTTPTMELMAELGVELEVHEAYLWHEKGRLLGTWQERARDARSSLDTSDPDDQYARDLLKKVYVAGLGITASEDHRGGKLGYAPVRYHHVMAKASANILRRVMQVGSDTGRWPVAIEKDTVVYTSDEIDATTAWPGKPAHYGRGLGQFKYEGSAPLETHARFLTGTGPYEGKSDLEELI